MSKSAFVGVDNIARKVKKMYVGVDGIARKVKKGYIGVNGVARLFFSGEKKLVYVGTATALRNDAYLNAATSVGNYMLVGSGWGSSTPNLSGVDAYDKNLTRTAVTDLSLGRNNVAATSNGKHALFAGGSSGTATAKKNVDIYDADLIRTTGTNLNTSSFGASAANVGEFMIVGGGQISGTNYTDSTTCYGPDLTIVSAPILSQKRTYMAAASNTKYAIFAGGTYGSSSSYCNNVDAYDTDLVLTKKTLPAVRVYMGAASVGNRVLLGGGREASGTVKNVYAYDENLTSTTATSLSLARYKLAAAGCDDYAIFAGGELSIFAGTVDNFANTAESYDKELTRAIPTTLSVARSQFAAVSNGKHIIFAGGQIQTSEAGTTPISTCPTAVVDVYLCD